MCLPRTHTQVRPYVAHMTVLVSGILSPCGGLASEVSQWQGTNELSIVAPTKAGTQRTLVNIERQDSEQLNWIPACAGMTVPLVDAKFIVLRQGSLRERSEVREYHPHPSFLPSREKGFELPLLSAME